MTEYEKQINEQALYWYSCKKEGMKKWQENDFYAWLQKDIQHKKSYEKLENIEKLCGTFSEDYIQNITNESLKGAKKTKTIEKIKSYSVAASFILILFISFFQSYSYFLPEYENSLITQLKPIKQLDLPDGSKLAIDAKTTLNIEFYNDKRSLTLLNGQAMFKVQKDKERPFIITAGRTKIEVIGTLFEVRNIEGKTTVKVEEGIVKVSHINSFSNKPQIITSLTKGKQITLDDKGKVLKYDTIPTETIALWREDTLDFNNTPIRVAVQEFSRYTNHKIYISSPEIENFEITGKFATTQQDKFFNALKNIYPIKIDTQNNDISLSKDHNR